MSSSIEGKQTPQDGVILSKRFLYCWPIVKGIWRWSMDYLNKEPVMQIFDVSLNKLIFKNSGDRWAGMVWWSIDIVVMRN